ncbi:MAG: ADP-ribosylation factor-like protein [Candidatus Kariarchaeaceae archaeon]|jgi:GTPase SAR1 family protein
MNNRQTLLSEEQAAHKIIIAGLDSVGKTSIYRKMIEGADIKEIENLPPTRGIERRSQIIMGHQVVFWDLGGQESYRSQYFENPKTFANTALLIYVLDVQDKERFDQSLDYLLQILMVVKHVASPPRIFVLMHKFDPDKIDDLKENFLEASKIFREVKKIPTLDVTRFPTSIYSDNLDFAFKKILQRVVPEYSNPLLDLFPEEEDTEDVEENEIKDNIIAGVEVDIVEQKNSSSEVLRAEITKQFELALETIDIRKKVRDNKEDL